MEDERFAGLDPAQKREKSFEALRNLFVRASEKHPLVLAIEDLHWIDRTSEEFIDYLIDWLPNTRILLILLYRPEYTHQWGSKSFYTKIGLNQLGIPSSTELIRAVLEGGQIAPELEQLILKRATGNPLFLEEFTHTLLENGTIQKQNHTYVLKKHAADTQVPDTIQGIIAARMDRLEDNLKRTMQVASVIGRDFAFQILQTITGLRDELKAHLLNLQGLEFIYEKCLFPELEYVFKHALIQEVAYNSLLHARRKEIHAKIGRAIETIYADRLEEFYEILAYHYTRSENMQKAVFYLDCSNRKAIRSHALVEAKTYFDEAMGLLDGLPDTQSNGNLRLTLLNNQVFSFFRLLQVAPYFSLLKKFKPLADKCNDPAIKGAFYRSYGHCELFLGHLASSARSLTRAIEMSESSGDAKLIAQSYAVGMWTYFCTDNYAKALGLREKLIQLKTRQTDLSACAWGLSCSSICFEHIGDWHNAIDDARQALLIAEQLSDNNQISWAAGCFAYGYATVGDFDNGINYAELSVQKADNPGDKVIAQCALAWIYYLRGAPEKCIALLTPVLTIICCGGFEMIEMRCMMLLGFAHQLAGDNEKAEAFFQKIIEISERDGSRWFAGAARRGLGTVYARRQPSQALDYFNAAIDILSEIRAERELASAYEDLGRFHLLHGNCIEARHALFNALALYKRQENAYYIHEVKALMDSIPT